MIALKKSSCLSYFTVILLCILFPASVDAATVAAASPSYTDVLSAVASASKGDTVVVPAGSATWSQTLYIRKGIHLQGAGRDSTFITSNTIAVEIAPDSTTIASEATIRLTGFTFDGNNAAPYILRVIGAWGNGTKPFKNLAIGNNRIRNAKPQTSSAAAIWTQGQVRGVIYGNIFDRVNVLLKIMGSNDSGQEWVNPAYYPFAYGNADNLFFEKNTIGWSSPNRVDGTNGWIESGQGGRVVVRYNTYNFANSDATEAWDVHGFQNWPGNGQTGTMIVEYYGNTLANFNGFRLVNHRGSWGLFHNNSATGAGGMAIHMSQYAVGDSGGSGMTAQVPGASGNYIAEINNTHVFNNTKNGSFINATRGSVGATSGVNENSHWWNFNASFNGTTGIGRGTTAPTGACSVGTAYWKASNPTPTTDPDAIQSGTLYKCLSPNIWTPYYTPFTYPHPLVSGSGGTASSPAVVSGATSGAVGTAFRYQIVASNGPTSYGASGLPSGLTLNSANGVITGTPSTSGNYSVGVSASNASGSGSANVVIAITASAPIGSGVTPALFDASGGVISAPFVVNGSDIAQPALTNQPSLGGSAVYTFNVTSPGNYAVAAEVNAVDESSNSLFVNMDAEPTATGMIWSIPPTSGFQLKPVTWGVGTLPQYWSLNAGTHRLIIRGREANTMLRSVSIIQRPSAPVGVVQTK